jgi:DNA-binding XRE family transcriptional regulator
VGPDAVRQGRRALGRKLASFREAAGYTQVTFAPLTHYGRSTIANVETGGQRAPREFWQRCDEVLSTGGVLTVQYDELEALVQHLHAQKARQGTRVPSTARSVNAVGAGDTAFVGPDDGAYVGVERAIMVAARQSSEHAMDSGAWAVSDTSIEQLRDDAIRIARGFALLTPAVAVSETLRIRDLAVTSLERTRRPAQQQELYLLTAQAAALLASASVDLGLWAAAMQYARATETYGEVIGHAGVRAYAKGMQATVAYWTGHPTEAVQHAHAAVDVAPAGIARVRAYCVLARAWSHRGAGNEVVQALAAADDARGDHGADVLHDVIGGEFGFTASQQARCASTAWLQADRPQQAITAAATALEIAAAQPAAPWTTVQAEARVDLATCQLLSGRLDAAQETLTPLWSIPPDWRRTGLLGRLRRIEDLLATDAWRQVPAARQAAERVASFAATRPAPPALPSA